LISQEAKTPTMAKRPTPTFFLKKCRQHTRIGERIPFVFNHSESETRMDEPPYNNFKEEILIFDKSNRN
jgi:hypothetical protein